MFTRRNSGSLQLRSERGQTIILVAISLISLLAMAALAIDVVTLYVARSEIQRAADAAALAGAKAIADSGITTLSASDPNFSGGLAQALALSMANAAITGVLPNNLVAGSAPTQAAGSPTFSFTAAQTTVAINDPWVQVTLQRTNLPTFFAHIWGTKAATVSATATAEAYNPANTPAGTQFTPIAPSCVKPWLVANKDPLQSGSPGFINISTGAIEQAVVTEQFDLSAACNGNNSGDCSTLKGPPWTPPGANLVYYLPAQVQSPANSADVCPSCKGSEAYENSIECCDVNAQTYLNCGPPVTSVNAQWNSALNPEANGANDLSAHGAECLMGVPDKTGSGQGQDFIDSSTAWPFTPFKIKAGSGPQFGNFVATSSSIATIPIFDWSTFTPASSSVTIVGFLQAFINCVEDGSHKNCDGAGSSTAGDINITILNVVGCSNSPNTANPVVGANGASAIPVRLIAPP